MATRRLGAGPAEVSQNCGLRHQDGLMRLSMRSGPLL